ncbi:MAG: response regulator transcription factor [Acidobacteria bacterium]|nr:response regulator transcription factor [Acidobacteriota bacterium]
MITRSCASRCRSCSGTKRRLLLRVLLADDHSLVRRGMRSLLESEGSVEVVAEAADGLEALRLCEEHHPDLLILDVAMPKLNGIDVAARSQKMTHPPRSIMLSMHLDESYVMRAINAGARGYLLKDATDEDLLPAIRAVAAGKSFFSPAVSGVLAAEYIEQLQARGLTDSYDLLTDREREVLQLLAEGRSNKEVASLLDVGLSTVETHRANLMQKLDLHSTAEIVLYAVRKRLIV